MKLPWLILILFLQSDAQAKSPCPEALALANCSSYVSDLEDEQRILQDAIKEARAERDDAMEQVSQTSGPLIPWYIGMPVTLVTGFIVGLWVHK
jgi:hypothetical protein